MQPFGRRGALRMAGWEARVALGGLVGGSTEAEDKQDECWRSAVGSTATCGVVV